MKKIFVLAFCILLTLAGVAGCGAEHLDVIPIAGDAPKPAAHEEPVPAAEPVSAVDTVSAPINNNTSERVDLGCCVTDILTRETALLGENNVTHVTDDFILTLSTSKHTYNTSENIEIWGTLEYIGDKDFIEIWSGCPFMMFSISGGSEIRVGNVLSGMSIDVLVSSILERGKVYHFEYQKSGGWSADDPNVEYWDDFFSTDDLQLLEGEYTLTLQGRFGLSENTLESKSGLKVTLTFEVVP